MATTFSEGNSRQGWFPLSPKAVLGAVMLHCAVISSAQLPDLYSAAFTIRLSTNAVFPGDNIQVTWLAANNGTYCIPEVPSCHEVFGPAFGPWEDAVFLVGESSNRLLGTSPFSGVLFPHQGYERNVGFAVPLDTAAGNYRIEVRIDYSEGADTGQVGEANEGNNMAQARSVLTVLPQLAFTSVTLSTNGTLCLGLRGAVQTPVRIQANWEVAGTNWIDVDSIPPLRGTTNYIAPAVKNGSVQFYRAVSP